jgi:hypothetical protein
MLTTQEKPATVGSTTTARTLQLPVTKRTSTTEGMMATAETLATACAPVYYMYADTASPDGSLMQYKENLGINRNINTLCWLICTWNQQQAIPITIIFLH